MTMHPCAVSVAGFTFVFCAEAVPASMNTLSARTTTPTSRLRLSMTSSSGLILCHPAAPECSGPTFERLAPSEPCPPLGVLLKRYHFGNQKSSAAGGSADPHG